MGKTLCHGSWNKSKQPKRSFKENALDPDQNQSLHANIFRLPAVANVDDSILLYSHIKKIMPRGSIHGKEMIETK